MNEVSPNHEHWREVCRRFEQKYSMSSDEFLLEFESGKLGDSEDFFDWYAAKRVLDLQQETQEK